MEATQIVQLCDRLEARLGEGASTRLQLIDIATVLMLVQRDLRELVDAPGGSSSGPVAWNQLNASLIWLHEHAVDAPLTALRARVAGAVHATAHMLGRELSHGRPEYSHLSHQESTHA